MNKVNDMTIGEQVHIIPLGHEYDRAVAPFHSRKADRAYVLAVPPTMELDPAMLRRQDHFTRKVISTLTDELKIPVRHCGVNLFDVKETMAAIASLIRMEQDAGNQVLVNMSACGRKTSYAATMAAMAHQVPAYYVTASGYIGGDEDQNESDQYLEHGISIVDDFFRPPERLYNFRLMMPNPVSLEILKKIHTSADKCCKFQNIIRHLHSCGVDGYDKLPQENKKGNLAPSSELRGLMNKTNRLYLKELEQESTRYITRTREGREYRFRLTKEGEIIACVSGLLEPPHWVEWKS